MDTRARILARDNGLCRCDECKEAASPLPASEVDHRVPLWDGGTDDDDNLQALNAECHKRKSAAEAERRSGAWFSTPAPAETPLAFLTGVMNDVTQDARLRVRAAVAAAQYMHVRKGDSGKKEERQSAAHKVGKGKFAPTVPPRLVVNNR